MPSTTPAGLVVGTAGHIDHGKTTLIRALTGMDTDRLAEEKQRGISIDLGFAHSSFVDGSTVSFVDVPGHERFIKNMLAGVSGIGAVMLIVAADSSVMPQTREHFQICRLLGIRKGFVVLTKCDLASAEQIGRTRADVACLCADSFLAGAPILPVSSVQQKGLEDVRTELARLLATRSQQPAMPTTARLAVDRSFSMKGFGTVVTGTLAGSGLKVGEMVYLHPGKRPARIRGLQVHGQPVSASQPSERTAVNLSGIESAELRRGDMLTASDIVEPSRVLDVALEWLPGHAPAHAREEVLFHIGAAEIVGHLQSFEPTLARIRLAEAVLAFPGDRFIIRRPSPADTVAGGTIIDSFPRLRLRRNKTVERLSGLLRSSLDERMERVVSEGRNGSSIRDLVKATGYRDADVLRSVQGNAKLLLVGGPQLVVTKAWLDGQRAKLLRWLAAFHAQNPAKAGASMSAARGSLPSDLSALVLRFDAVRIASDSIALAGHTATHTERELAALAKMEWAFRSGGFSPPAVSDVLRDSMPDGKKALSLLDELVKSNKLVRIAEGLIFHSEVIAHIRTSLSGHKGRRFSVPEFKQWTQISRKYAIPLLEYLDQQRVTRREGDNRVVL